MARPFGIERPRAGEILRRVNEGLHQDLLKVDMFATLVLLRLDLSERRLEFANAGHPFPLLLRAGRVIPFHEAPGLARIVDGPDGVNLIPPDGPVRPGMPIGFLPDTGYTTWGFDLVPGDAALLFTDGMTEVFDDESSPNRRVFGEERLADAFARAANLPAAESLLAIAREIDEWSGGADFRDDQTAILLRIPRPADASAPPPSSPATTPDYTI